MTNRRKIVKYSSALIGPKQQPNNPTAGRRLQVICRADFGWVLSEEALRGRGSKKAMMSVKEEEDVEEEGETNPTLSNV